MAEKKAILLRISPELWDGLNRWARDELRSVNAQIEYVLREALRRRSGAPVAVAAADGPLPVEPIHPPHEAASGGPISELDGETGYP